MKNQSLEQRSKVAEKGSKRKAERQRKAQLLHKRAGEATSGRRMLEESQRGHSRTKLQLDRLSQSQAVTDTEAEIHSHRS